MWPVLIGLTDRDDGTVWYLSTETVDDEIYISIDTERPFSNPTKHVIYEAHAGPIVNGLRPLRLLVRGGYLGFEIVDRPIDIDTPRIYAHIGPPAGRSEIIPAGWSMPEDTIGYRTP